MSALQGGSTIEEKYRQKSPKSFELTRRAAKVMPGGETRSGVYHPPYSLTLDHGKGSRCWDIDGNEYIDVLNNYTCLVHGHAFPPIVEAATVAVRKGSTWTAKAVKQVELAELIAERSPAVDQVRFTNSGTEAVLSALAIARAHTGRHKFLFSRYSYHGHLIEVNSADGAWIDCFTAEYGDAASFEAVLAEHGDEIAGVMLEPVLGLGGMVSAPRDFFLRVQRAAHRAGALFMLDEATVFRAAIGGVQKFLDIEPDLSVLGKYVGGGFPCGTVGGKAEIMEILNPAGGKVQISGTFSGNPVSMAAGTEAVRHYTQEHVDAGIRRMQRIEESLKASAKKYGLPMTTRRFEGLMNIYLSDELPAYNQLRQDDRLASLFQLACFVNGIFTASRLVMNTPTVMTDGDLEELLQRFDAVVADVAAEA